MRKILVIGGTGFIGYHIITEAKKRKWDITSISLNKPKKKDIIKMLIINKLISKILNL